MPERYVHDESLALDGPEVELNQLLPNNEWKQNIIMHYMRLVEWAKGFNKHRPHAHTKSMIDGHVYADQIVASIKIIRDAMDKSKEIRALIYNLIKTTRAGCTTNIIIACLMLDVKVLVVEPVNKIAYDTVLEALNIYRFTTIDKSANNPIIDVENNIRANMGDLSKRIRQIPSNTDGCCVVVNEHSNYPEVYDKIPFTMGGKCSECEIYHAFPDSEVGEIIPKATMSRCTIKTMMKEKQEEGEAWRPDIVTITYDKLMLLNEETERGAFFTDMINNVDIIVLDEIGAYVSRTEKSIDTFVEYRKDDGVEYHDVTSSTSREIFESFIESAPDKIRKSISELVREYLYYFIDGECKYIHEEYAQGVSESLVNHTEFKLMTRKHNVLADSEIEIEVKHGPKKVKEKMSRLDAIKIMQAQYYDDLVTYMIVEDSLYNKAINEEDNPNGLQYVADMKDVAIAEHLRNQEIILLLIDIISIMTYDEHLAFSSDGVDYDKNGDVYDKVNLKKICLYPITENVLDRIKSKLGDKPIIITDATMPAYCFDALESDIDDIYYGDPKQTNNALLVINDATIRKFSVDRWFRDIEYKKEVSNKLINLVNDNITRDDIVIWSPNIKVGKEINEILNSNSISSFFYNDKRIEPKNDETSKGIIKNRKVKGNAKTSTVIDEEIKEFRRTHPRSHCVTVSYYGSSMTRGVESSSRIQIALSRATKPMGSYDHVAFLQSFNWNLISDDDMHVLAEKHKLTIHEFKDKIDEWAESTKVNTPYCNIGKNNSVIPEYVKDFYVISSKGILKERVCMDTLQAVSRVKDSKGEKRSILICVGWNENEILEMLIWGNHNSMKYLLTKDNNVKRYAPSQDYIIAPPRIVTITKKDVENGKSVNKIVSDWIAMRDIDDSLIGFDSNIENGILNMLLYRRRSMDSEEVWMEMSKNMMVGHETERYDNGYLVGSIRAIEKSSAFGEFVKCEEVEDGRFIFDLFDGEKVYPRLISNTMVEYVIRILKVAYMCPEDKVTMSYLRNHVHANILKSGLPIINLFGLLNGSSWSLEIKMRDNKQVFTIYKDKTKLKELVVSNANPLDKPITKAVKRLYRKTKVGGTITPTDICKEVKKGTTIRDIEGRLKVILRTYEDFRKLDMDCILDSKTNVNGVERFFIVRVKPSPV